MIFNCSHTCSVSSLLLAIRSINSFPSQPYLRWAGIDPLAATEGLVRFVSALVCNIPHPFLLYALSRPLPHTIRGMYGRVLPVSCLKQHSSVTYLRGRQVPASRVRRFGVRLHILLAWLHHVSVSLVPQVCPEHLRPLGAPSCTTCAANMDSVAASSASSCNEGFTGPDCGTCVPSPSTPSSPPSLLLQLSYVAYHSGRENKAVGHLTFLISLGTFPSSDSSSSLSDLVRLQCLSSTSLLLNISTPLTVAGRLSQLSSPTLHHTTQSVSVSIEVAMRLTDVLWLPVFLGGGPPHVCFGWHRESAPSTALLRSVIVRSSLSSESQAWGM